MNSKRLQGIASLITINNKVIDIGTDHGYLPIYLVKEKNFKNVACSDISLDVLEGTKKNIQKYNLESKIAVYLSDGFINLPKTYDTAVLSGMGFYTIKKILEYNKLPRELIICCHNNLDMLRSFMQKIGYKIIKEVVVYEKGKYYVIIKYQKGIDNLTIEEIKFGKNYDYHYLNYLKEKYQKLKIEQNISKYDKLIKELQAFIEKIPD